METAWARVLDGKPHPTSNFSNSGSLLTAFINGVPPRVGIYTKLLDEFDVSRNTIQTILTFDKCRPMSPRWSRWKRCCLTQEKSISADPGACSWTRGVPSGNAEGTIEVTAEEHFQGWENCKSWQTQTTCLGNCAGQGKLAWFIYSCIHIWAILSHAIR